MKDWTEQLKTGEVYLHEDMENLVQIWKMIWQ